MNHKILIVDDEVDACKTMGDFLEKNNYVVITANNGKEALSKFTLEKPNLILLDINMPDMDGIQCLGQIKKLDKKAMVIMVTCITDIEVAKKAVELGAIDYITKPIGFDALQIAITTYLFLKEAEQAL
jgi:two-component system response regulator HydG